MIGRPAREEGPALSKMQRAGFVAHIKGLCLDD